MDVKEIVNDCTYGLAVAIMAWETVKPVDWAAVSPFLYSQLPSVRLYSGRGIVIFFFINVNICFFGLWRSELRGAARINFCLLASFTFFLNFCTSAGFCIPQRGFCTRTILPSHFLLASQAALLLLVPPTSILLSAGATSLHFIEAVCPALHIVLEMPSIIYTVTLAATVRAIQPLPTAPTVLADFSAFVPFAMVPPVTSHVFSTVFTGYVVSPVRHFQLVFSSAPFALPLPNTTVVPLVSLAPVLYCFSLHVTSFEIRFFSSLPRR